MAQHMYPYVLEYIKDLGSLRPNTTTLSQLI
jgi:hypothetical protein